MTLAAGPVRTAVRTVLALLFVTAGTLHLLAPQPFVRIVPPGFPAPALLVTVSGCAEIAGGIGLLVPRTRRAAGFGLIALLVAVFPANIFMAVDARAFRDVAPAWALWTRLPFQLVLVAAAAWCGGVGVRRAVARGPRAGW